MKANKMLDGMRSFEGKIDGFKDKIERAMEKRHLKAYLKGWELFQWGMHPQTGQPKMYHVNQRIRKS